MAKLCIHSLILLLVLVSSVAVTTAQTGDKFCNEILNPFYCDVKECFQQCVKAHKGNPKCISHDGAASCVCTYKCSYA
ncbi:hypothetical protein RHMOL_Rhmol04G0129900 [Rhododendron molle]|uniref:Uncharacterized protein n=1 Tax=Rhododendron molle TaxID=49168 RepID=A0ACC0P1J6_RHOML|nr:hypothetical protein RHMOL_Rhmol04G0129900 [Rhododendron molle]